MTKGKIYIQRETDSLEVIINGKETWSVSYN